MKAMKEAGMYNDRDPMSMNRDPMNWGGGNLSIEPGSDVYDSNGEKVGMVQQYNPQANCIVMEQSGLFGREIYIPTDNIERTTTSGVYLDLSKDQLNQDQYTAPPPGIRAYPYDTNPNRDTDINP